MSKLSLVAVSIVILVLMACSAPEPTPAPAPTARPAPTSAPAPTPTPRPAPTPEPVVVCVPEVVDYVTDMADEVEAVIEAGEDLDELLEDRSDSLVWRAKVAKVLLDMGGAVTTIATTTPPEPLPAVYEEIKDVAADFKRILESEDVLSGESVDTALEEAAETLKQAISALSKATTSLSSGWTAARTDPLL